MWRPVRSTQSGAGGTALFFIAPRAVMPRFQMTTTVGTLCLKFPPFTLHISEMMGPLHPSSSEVWLTARRLHPSCDEVFSASLTVAPGQVGPIVTASRWSSSARLGARGVLSAMPGSAGVASGQNSGTYPAGRPLEDRLFLCLQ